jgi:hypothetical protein
MDGPRHTECAYYAAGLEEWDACNVRAEREGETAASLALGLSLAIGIGLRPRGAGRWKGLCRICRRVGA